MAAALLGCLPFLAAAQTPALPKSPVTINVVDVGGALALLQDAIDSYKTTHPNVVSKITYTKAPAPELPGKLKAMQQHGIHVDLDDMGMVESIHLCLFHWVLNDVFARINNEGRYAAR